MKQDTRLEGRLCAQGHHSAITCPACGKLECEFCGVPVVAFAPTEVYDHVDTTPRGVSADTYGHSIRSPRRAE